MASVDDLYNTQEEQERLALIMEQRYTTMLKAVHEAVRLKFGLKADQFRLTDHATNAILVDAAERVVRIDEVTRQAIAEQLRLGQELGLSTWEIANGVPAIGYHGIDGLYAETWKGRANVIARTELQHAQNEAAMNRYMATGLVDRLEIVDGDEDAPCASRNGRVVSISERPQLQHPNCLVGGQIVLAPNWQAGSTRYYNGEMVVLRTAANDLLTVTPNHPVLSTRGWKAAGTINLGDYVIRCRAPERVVLLVDPYHDYRPSLIENVANPTRPPGHCPPTTVPSSPEQFHGDGGDADVYVVWADGIAGHSTPTKARFTRSDHRQHQHVKVSDADHSAGACYGTLDEAINWVGVAAASGMRGRGMRDPVLNAKSRLTQFGRFGHGPGPSMFTQPVRNGSSRDAEHLRNLYGAELLSDVEVVEIRRFLFSGHVYNVQTEQGWYIAQNIVTHNCTMNVIPILREGIA